MKTSRESYRNFIRAILVGASSKKGKPLYAILESELKAEDSRLKFYYIYVNIVEELERLVDPDNPDGYKYGEFLDSTELYCGAVFESYFAECKQVIKKAIDTCNADLIPIDMDDDVFFVACCELYGDPFNDDWEQICDNADDELETVFNKALTENFKNEGFDNSDYYGNLYDKNVNDFFESST